MYLEGKNVFLSGPMSGMEHFNAAAFAEAHAICREMGARDVYDPSHEWMYDRHGEERHESWMMRCIHRLSSWTRTSAGEVRPSFDVMVQLDGWERSAGASLEREVAMACGIPCIGVHEVREGR